MQGSAFTEWEVRSAILSSRAQTLEQIAGDETLTLEAGDRALLQRVAKKLRERSRQMMLEGRV